MRIRMSDRAVRQYRALPLAVRAKADKQFGHLLKDVRHPSLHAKKYKGYEDVWQARIDQDWRFYFHIVEPHYVIVSIISHPK
jgi:mRNA-degrading endonuclease RelE of RelBE toxin-antitoxin system